jgi:biotin carboxyl carrier protein
MKTYNITVNGQTYVVNVEEVAGGAAAPVAAPVVETKNPVAAAPAPKAAPKAAPVAGGKVKITAPMPGNIVKVCVSAGAAVKKGDVLCVLEAMKMENEIKAPEDGTVASVAVNSGASVSSGDVLVTLD